MGIEDGDGDVGRGSMLVVMVMVASRSARVKRERRVEMVWDISFIFIVWKVVFITGFSMDLLGLLINLAINMLGLF